MLESSFVNVCHNFGFLDSHFVVALSWPKFRQTTFTFHLFCKGFHPLQPIFHPSGALSFDIDSSGSIQKIGNCLIINLLGV
jgi:hypothetical protein